MKGAANYMGWFRWLVLIAMMLKELAYWIWIVPKWWAAHAAFFRALAQAVYEEGCDKRASRFVEAPPSKKPRRRIEGFRRSRYDSDAEERCLRRKTQCDLFKRLMHPLMGVRTMFIMEAALKGVFLLVILGFNRRWKASGVDNTLYTSELFFVGCTVINSSIWRMLIRSHQEALCGHRIEPGRVVSFYQKWIDSWVNLSFILCTLFFWAQEYH